MSILHKHDNAKRQDDRYRPRGKGDHYNDRLARRYSNGRADATEYGQAMNAMYDHRYINPDRFQKNDSWMYGNNGYAAQQWRDNDRSATHETYLMPMQSGRYYQVQGDVYMQQDGMIQAVPAIAQGSPAGMNQLVFVADYPPTQQEGVQKMAVMANAAVPLTQISPMNSQMAQSMADSKSPQGTTPKSPKAVSARTSKRKIINKSIPSLENPDATPAPSGNLPFHAVPKAAHSTQGPAFPQTPGRKSAEKDDNLRQKEMQHYQLQMQQYQYQLERQFMMQRQAQTQDRPPRQKTMRRLTNKTLGRDSLDSEDPVVGGGVDHESRCPKAGEGHTEAVTGTRKSGEGQSRALASRLDARKPLVRGPTSDRVSAREFLAFRECCYDVPPVMLTIRAIEALEMDKYRELAISRNTSSWPKIARMNSKEARKHSRTKAQSPPTEAAPLRKSANSRAFSGDPHEEIKRTVNSILNKMCPEKFDVLSEKLASLEISTAAQLTIIIDSVFTKAVTEHAYCEMYSDLCMALRPRYPNFPGEVGEPEYTFTRALLNRCQEEFDNLPYNFADEIASDRTPSFPSDGAGREGAIRKAKDKVMGNMKFIGQLFLRRLLSNKVVREVVVQLVFREEKPMDHYIECLCILLRNIGASLESTATGAEYCSLFIERLKQLSGLDYSKRIKFAMQAIIELQANQWQERILHEKAKTKDEVRRDQIFEERRRTTGVHNPFAVTEIAGQRPSYIRNPS